MGVAWGMARYSEEDGNRTCKFVREFLSFGRVFGEHLTRCDITINGKID